MNWLNIGTPKRSWMRLENGPVPIPVLHRQRDRQTHRHAGHGFDAAGEHHILRSAHHRLRGELHRLLR
jgi:hypothetical protein